MNELEAAVKALHTIVVERKWEAVVTGEEVRDIVTTFLEGRKCNVEPETIGNNQWVIRVLD